VIDLILGQWSRHFSPGLNDLQIGYKLSHAEFLGHDNDVHRCGMVLYDDDNLLLVKDMKTLERISQETNIRWHVIQPISSFLGLQEMLLLYRCCCCRILSDHRP
jgi:hypothetical protein